MWGTQLTSKSVQPHSYSTYSRPTMRRRRSSGERIRRLRPSSLPFAQRQVHSTQLAGCLRDIEFAGKTYGFYVQLVCKIETLIKCHKTSLTCCILHNHCVRLDELQWPPREELLFTPLTQLRDLVFSGDSKYPGHIVQIGSLKSKRTGLVTSPEVIL